MELYCLTLIYPVFSSPLFSKSYFSHMLTQRQNLAQSIHREKKRMHPLAARAELAWVARHFGAEAEPRAAHGCPEPAPSALVQPWQGAAGRASAPGRIHCFGLSEAKRNHLFGRLLCLPPTSQPRFQMEGEV